MNVIHEAAFTTCHAISELSFFFSSFNLRFMMTDINLSGLLFAVGHVINNPTWKLSARHFSDQKLHTVYLRMTPLLTQSFEMCTLNDYYNVHGVNVNFRTCGTC